MQVKLIRYALLIISIFFVLGTTCFAQKSIEDINSSNPYNKAIELFNNEKYVAAQKYFQDVIADQSNTNTIIKENAQYYSMICAIALYNDNAELLGDGFVAENPESPFKNDALFRLGKYEYVKKKYKQSIAYFAKVDKDELNDDDRAEYYFKTGYSWFLLDSLEQARKYFYEIKDIDTRYTSPAIYYYAHIAYSQKNYETAIENFNKLKTDETFAPIVPYYITQCYYFQEKFDDLLNYAPPLIDSVVETRVAEMAKMIGDAYYHKNQFKEAIPYYERFFAKGNNFMPDDYYQCGYCFYSVNEFEKAVSYFEKSSSGNSALAQNANYHLGDCYIRLNLKDKALLAFNNAAKMDFDLNIKEDAAFNYAELTYEKSTPPFSSSIKALNDYITQYPNSRRSDEAYNYLISACLNTHNYQDAITYLGKINVKDNKIKKAYQRAAFYRGLELFNNLQFDEAMKMFVISQKYAEYDQSIAARCEYWMAEIYYRQKNIEDALDFYNQFSAFEVAKNCPEYRLSLYNIAYCYFNKKDYNKSTSSFLKYINYPKVKKDKIYADAYNRLGDCKFMDSKYDEAIDYYTKSIELGSSDKDYAIFQKAFSLGLKGEHKKKISLLNQMLTSNPESKLNGQALFEIGRSYVILQNSSDAIKYFNKLMSNYPSSSYVKNALLQLGLINFNAGKNDTAINIYKKVVADYPGTQEAKSALTGIKNIYLSMNNIDEYLKYSESLGDFANVSAAEKDSLMYLSGENAYTSSDFVTARNNFKKYIDKFPKGNFILNSKYYYGDCNQRLGNPDTALLAFNFVISKPRNSFTELALASAAKIELSKKDSTSALSNYIVLDSVAEVEQNIIDARVGIMHINYTLKNYDKASAAADKVLKTSGIAQEIERNAKYIQAKSLLAIGDNQKALIILKKLATDVKNSEGAESKFLIANFYYNNNQQDLAQKEIFNFIDLNSPQQYWVAKAFILLAEIYHNKKDDFQAINTLKSIIDNYGITTDNIITEAKEKKDLYEANSRKQNENSSDDDNK